MKVWLMCFVLMFCAVELYQWAAHISWIQQVELPLPVLMLAGAALAIASNYNKRLGLPWQAASPLAGKSSTVPDVKVNPSSVAQEQSPVSPVVNAPSTPVQPQPSPPQPIFNPPVEKRSISFTIQKPNQ